MRPDSAIHTARSVSSTNLTECRVATLVVLGKTTRSVVTTCEVPESAIAILSKNSARDVPPSERTILRTFAVAFQRASETLPQVARLSVASRSNVLPVVASPACSDWTNSATCRRAVWYRIESEDTLVSRGARLLSGGGRADRRCAKRGAPASNAPTPADMTLYLRSIGFTREQKGS